MGSKPGSLRYSVLRAAHAASSALRSRLHRLSDGLQHKIALDYLFVPRPDDIFVVTYPKSGTTLLQMMLYQLTTAGEMDFPHIDSVCPWWEMELHVGRPEVLESMDSPRILKSHLRPRMLPKVGRKVYVARAVDDVAISAYHHHCLITGIDHDLEEFVRGFPGGWQMFGSWYRHLEAWWPHRHDENVLFLTFEEAVRDLGETARRVAEFCGLDADAETIARVRERCSFESMSAHDEKFDPRLRRFTAEAGAFIRRGRSGDGRARLGPESQAMLERHLSALRERLDVPAGEPEPWRRLFRPKVEGDARGELRA